MRGSVETALAAPGPIHFGADMAENHGRPCDAESNGGDPA